MEKEVKAKAKPKAKKVNPHFKKSRVLAKQSAFEFGKGCRFEYNRVFNKKKVEPTVAEKVKHEAGMVKDKVKSFFKGWFSKETEPIVATV